MARRETRTPAPGVEVQVDIDCLMAERDGHLQKLADYEDLFRRQDAQITKLHRQGIVKSVGLLAVAAVLIASGWLLWPSLNARMERDAAANAARERAVVARQEANLALCQGVCQGVNPALSGSYEGEKPGAAICECSGSLAGQTEELNVQIPRDVPLAELQPMLALPAGPCFVWRPVCTQAEAMEMWLVEGKLMDTARVREPDPFVLQVVRKP